jgi:hypothetical protein
MALLRRASWPLRRPLFLVTESVIDHAIELETLRRQAAAFEEPMLSRNVQKVAVRRFVIYGLTWLPLFGAVFHVAQRWLPGKTPQRRALSMAGMRRCGRSPFYVPEDA